MSSLTTTTFQPDYVTWHRRGFVATTPRVSKRRRPDGLYDVVYQESNGYYSLWIAEASSIWLVVQEVLTVEALLDLEDLDTVLRHFPPEPLALAQQYAFPFSLPYAIRHASASSATPIPIETGADEYAADGFAPDSPATQRAAAA